MASPLGPAARKNRLESTLAANARALGTTHARYRDAFNRTMLLMTLHRAIEVGILEDYHLKGGAAIEVRHGFGARATLDVDIELPVPLAQLTTVFASAIGVGCGDFTFALRPEERPVREDAVSVSVVMRYLLRPWATISVDLAPAQPGNLADSLPLLAVEFPDITGEARTMKTEFQIAQKIHAVTTPDPAGHLLPYARHVVDVLYLASTDVSPSVIGAACQAVFDARSVHDGRSWPPPAIVLPERWITEYGVTLEGYGMALPPEGVPRAFLTLLATIVGGVVPMPGYEYQFVSLVATRVGQGLADPIESRGLQAEHFNQLAANGWRVRSMCPNPSAGGYVLVILEREIAQPA
jgi:Nucleotidyl transferase AbiEii toxin, Type IV TA system